MISKVVNIDKTDDKKSMQKVVSKTESVDRALADRYISTGKYELQRHLSEAHVAELMREMMNGTFQEGTAIDIAELGDRYFLINGQHTLAAIVKSDIPQNLVVKRYRVTSMTEVGQIYSRLDIQRTRSPFDRLHALGVPDALGINHQETTAVVAGLKLILARFQNAPGAKVTKSDIDRTIFKSADRWAKAIEEYRKPIAQYLEAINFTETKIDRRRFLRSGAVSIGLVTLRHQNERAWDFWAAAAADDGLRSRDPAHRLSTWLLTNPAGGGTRRGVFHARYIASCWNAFYEGRELSKVYPADVDLVGITIAGTPFKARKRL